MQLRFLFLSCIMVLLLSGCFLNKIVTVPMRVGGAIISVVPICGDTIDDAIDEAADLVDEVPL